MPSSPTEGWGGRARQVRQIALRLTGLQSCVGPGLSQQGQLGQLAGRYAEFLLQFLAGVRTGRETGGTLSPGHPPDRVPDDEQHAEQKLLPRAGQAGDDDRPVALGVRIEHPGVDISSLLSFMGSFLHIGRPSTE